MRKRQKKKLEQRERAREERLQRGASEEFDRHVVYRTTFGPTTLDDLENAWEFYKAEILEGSNWQNRALKIEGILTPAGIELKQKLRREAGLE